jgi:hypothetical protein
MSWVKLKESDLPLTMEKTAAPRGKTPVVRNDSHYDIYWTSYFVFVDSIRIIAFSEN